MMGSLRKIIEKLLKEDPEGHGFLLGSLACFLLVLSFLYGFIALIRRRIYALPGFSKKLPCVVISVGNITAGGSGKTPMAIYLAGLLSEKGHKVAIVSRGYKGGFEKNGGIVSDGKTVLAGPSEAGDEPYLMARKLNLPVICGRDRYRSGLEAIKLGAEIIILDDGFQHIRLKRDIDILLMDFERPLGNGFVLPRGLMREPASAIEHADIVVMTRSPDHFSDSSLERYDNKLKNMLSDKPVFFSSHRQYLAFSSSDKEMAGLSGRNVFVVSGIADNVAFLSTIKSAAGGIAGSISFDDHHSYSEDDYSLVLSEARAKGADAIVTTEKDYVKISALPDECKDCDIQWIVLGVEHDLGERRSAFEEKLFGEVLNAKQGKGRS